MTFTIYRIQRAVESSPFYDIEINNLVGSLGISDSIIEIIKKIENQLLDNFHFLIFHRLESVYDCYGAVLSCTVVYEHEFGNSEDLRENLRSLIQEHHPELLI